MTLKKVTGTGWYLAWVFDLIEDAKKAWQEAINILRANEATLGKMPLGIYRIRLIETGPPHLVMFGDGNLPEGLLEQFEAVALKGRETEIPMEILMSLLLTYEATRNSSGGLSEVHNLRILPITRNQA